MMKKTLAFTLLLALVAVQAAAQSPASIDRTRSSSGAWTGKHNNTPRGTLTPVGGVFTPPWSYGNWWITTGAGSQTIACPPDIADGDSMNIHIQQGNSAPFSPNISFNAPCYGWSTGVQPTWSTAANAVDWVFCQSVVPTDVTGASFICAPQLNAGTICSQGVTFLARTSGENTAAIAALICGLVTDGVITGTLAAGGSHCGAPFDRIFIHAMANSTDGLLDLCGNTSAVLHGSPTFTANAGFTGTSGSSTIYIDTGFNPNTAGGNYIKDNAHLSLWSLDPTGVGDNTNFVMGGTDGTNSDAFFIQNGAGNVTVRINNSGGGLAGTGSSTVGWFEGERTGASARALYQNTTLLASDAGASSGLPNVNQMTLGLNNNGTVAGGAIRTAVTTFGASLTSGQKTSFNTRMCTYLTAVHGSC